MAAGVRWPMGQRRTETSVALAYTVNSAAEQNHRSGQTLRTIEMLLRELVAALPEKIATIQVKHESRCSAVELVPANPNAASIDVLVPHNAEKVGVTLIAGRGSFFEVPIIGYRYTDLPFREEIRSICLAVITGGLEESVVLDGDEVLQGKGTIKLPQASTPTTVHWHQVYFRPFRKKQRKHFKYEPYAPSQTDSEGLSPQT